MRLSGDHTYVMAEIQLQSIVDDFPNGYKVFASRLVTSMWFNEVTSAWTSRTARWQQWSSCSLSGATRCGPNKLGDENTPAIVDTPSRNDVDVESRGWTCVDLNGDQLAVSSGFEGGTSRRVTCETFGADRPC